MAFQRIEICGGIASGKTTLTTLLSENGYTAIFENFQSNPFWKKFYENPIGTAFETELTFFLQHYHGIKTSSNHNSQIAFDHSLLLDLAYARVTLQGRRLSIFDNVFEEVWQEVLAPTLIVYLRCDPKTELSRIRKRAREVEKSIDLGYLSALNSSLGSVIAEFRSNLLVLEIDSGKVDFANDADAKVAVVNEIRRAMSSGRIA